MKKFIALLTSLSLGFSLVGCGSTIEEQDSEQSTTSGTTTEATNESTTTVGTEAEDEIEVTIESTENKEDTAGKVLVIYYSATGSTEAVAEYIAEATGGDLFELEPVEPYTSDDLNWTDSASRVSQEYANEELRDVELVSTTVTGWDSYDTVFIGYPIWWGIAAWAVDGFVSANDFTGKTVIPFCTSSSSGIGQSGELLADLAGTGDWQDGQRFRSNASEDDVVAWVEGLELDT